MKPRALVHTALLLAVISAVGVVVMDRASAAEWCELQQIHLDRKGVPLESAIPGVSRVGNDASRASLDLAVGQSCIFDFQHVIKDVLVADPKIANVVMRSSTRVYINGNQLGATNIVFFDTQGRQMARFEIAINRDVDIITRAIKKQIPTSHVTVESIGDGIILTGTAVNQADAQEAYAIASRFIASGSNFANSSGGGGSASASGSSGGSSGGSSAAPLAAACPSALVTQAAQAVAATPAMPKSTTRSLSSVATKSC